MNTNTRIPIAQRDELIAIYMAAGMKAVEEKAAEDGVTGKYVANAAHFKGLIRHRRADGTSSRTGNDPRWERAKAVGEVRA
ncbi:hypothetical protein IVA94_14725 [Bradyrhizobium sp. 156]|uniref:hypothetical protein n=1 Tax=Bradyrhizobium sp. 156 TaxID=2782630 RepID=UPI001FF922B6|nr:hypothetical protein [Bradyrhizobium sp. 156]MCK1322123.1 hypothetical protein [Bradyrhizobium sp. 156]